MGCTQFGCNKGDDPQDLRTTFSTNLVRMEKPDRFFQDYEVGITLGEGITGTVKVVKHRKTGEEFAMKTINLARIDKSQLKELQNEIRILRQLDHPHVVRLLQTYQDKKHIYIIMELCTGGTLSKRRLKTERQVRRVVAQLLMACSYCHSQGVVHRDLKLENIMFTDESEDSDIKVIDFGLSATFHTDPSLPLGKGADIKNNKAKRMFLTTCGTAYYMAPEILYGSYSEACDLWAIGVITFMLLTGRPPFDGKTEDEVFNKLELGRVKYTSPVWEQVNGHAKSLVQHLLVVDTSRRWTAEKSLQSPWIQEYSKQMKKKHSTEGNAELELEVVESLQRFTQYSYLKKAALMVIAHHVGQHEISDLKNSFLELDENRTGYITLSELHSVLSRHGVSDDNKVQQLFTGLDQDRSGKIRYLEFLAATIETRCIVDANRLGAAFDHLDEDNSGFITVANMKKLLGGGFSSSEVERIVHECDLTGDNRVSRDEFIRIMGEGHEIVSTKAHNMVGEIEKEENLPTVPESGESQESGSIRNAENQAETTEDVPAPIAEEEGEGKRTPSSTASTVATEIKDEAAGEDEIIPEKVDLEVASEKPNDASLSPASIAPEEVVKS